MFVGKARTPTLGSKTWKVLQLGMLQAYLQTLDYAGKAYQGQKTIAYYENS